MTETPYEAPLTIAAQSAQDSALDTDALPPLLKDTSFHGMVGTQFLGAFNDNLFKQLMLLLALKVAAWDMQPVAMFVFSLPFLLFSGYAGYLSDRFSKRNVIVLAKVAEIVVMALGMVGFLLFLQFGFPGLLLVLFLMGTQSAFFGPGKYGILPEMLRPSDLPRANGLILMTTFLAIIFGTAAAGFLTKATLREGQQFEVAATGLWLASGICILIAVTGTLTSLLIRRVAASNPKLAFETSALTIPLATRQMLNRDRPLCYALLASCMFWLLAGVTQQAVNSLGEKQLGLTDDRTSILVASIGVGIALGAIAAGKLSRGRADFHVMRFGCWGMIGCLLILALPGPQNGHLLGFWGSLPMLVLLGMGAGMFAIPLQVFMQARPPEGLKGRMIAVMNQANFAAIFLSAGVYWLFDQIVLSLGWNRSPIFAFMALIMLPVAILYRPEDEPLK
jgi:acyl-[acyl-carrier-protein]-phospholipid O-acyltransferase/long-chain-fatty-acid--[acyl-carrier-protein] ligase